MIGLLAALGMAGIAAAVPPAAASQAVVAADHSLGLSGAPNFRDLGGYRTTDGRIVRHGLVFRSSKLAALTPADWTRVAALGVGHVFDLRTVAERRSEPDGWPAPAPPTYGSPKEDLSGWIAEMKRAGTDADAVRDAIRHFYSAMPALYAPEYAAVFRGLADADTPVLIHCTAGKDRTGVASALLLTALGVPRATVIGDYELTDQLLPRAPMRTSGAPAGRPSMPIGGKGASALLAMPPATQEAIWAADPTYLAAALDTVTTRYGSIEAYLHTALGLTDAEIARLRQRLLE